MSTINVIENPGSALSSTPIRVEPVQARSTVRLNALLDAASDAMHDLGYEQLTTAMVAERAGASIGTVYRYFPDRIAVLVAVAAKNLDKATRAVQYGLDSQQPSTIEETIDATVNALVGVFRVEKGFRSIRVGDCLDIRPSHAGRQGNAEIARVVRDDLHERLGIRLDSTGRLAVETAIDVTDKLLGRAFLSSERGDSSLIEEARRMAQAAVAGL